ncbi:type IV secretion system protein [Xanthomonas campestris pv. raphani]|uniref:virB8 family protein n=1 Tax=Xanthomonas campestris TaxID=339 RepID=UPI000E0F1722|nr:type IV secretion system protein [Xanthomonas campestris]MCW2036412.1 type IV secretion system protein VirB8 [Xanthomonas campestris]MEA0735035.1 type IV secretion system protein [Xanthomonas campestris pv. campestris]MEA9787833.1 type IV secretion system protein [Xanthomonas campestris pv. raphani]MEA9827249.1 type IV secretion system protein [Xanthomonas campestris pv. raphani]TXD40868.1 type IV secretion system protein [Xanthomonas campestris]
MFRKKEPSRQVDQVVAKAVNYELTIADLAQRSQRRAWMVATTSLAVSVMLAGGYYYMLPLKEKVPYLVMADASTGTATVARLQGDFYNQQITSSEAINRSNVAQYVTARESYDSEIMTLRDWNLVFIMSTAQVGAGHKQLYMENNPDNPFLKYGKAKSIRVKILSITPLGQRASGGFRGAAVRIQRNLYEKTTGISTFIDNKLITLAFDYNDNLKLDEQDRLQNPLGFQVTEYRVDNDYDKAPPDVGTPATGPSASAGSAQPQIVASPNSDLAAPAIGIAVPATAEPDAARSAEGISIGTDGARGQ